MDDSCRAFRDEWLSAEGVDRSHASLCPDCAHWAYSAGRQREALCGLESLSAPLELEGRVARELAGDRSRRLERALGSLSRLGAPALLDECVAEMFAGRTGDEERGRQKAQAVRALEVQRAPSVLERLVNEELATPGRQRVERFTGSLEKLTAPPLLAKRIGSSVRRRALVRLVLGPLVTLAAASLVVWFVVGHVSEPRRRTFQVVQASSLEDLDPLARALAESLGGAAPR